MKNFKQLKKLNYFSALSGWIANLGVVPLLLLRAFLLLPIFDFLLALLFLVTRVLETITQLLSVSNNLPPFKTCDLMEVTKRATRCPRHKFINLQVLRPYHFLVKALVVSIYLILQTHSATAKSNTKYQRVSGDITLAKGELKRLTTGGVSRFSVGNKEVLKVKVVGQDLLLKGQSIGHSDLLLWPKRKDHQAAGSSPLRYSVFVVRKSTQLKLMQLAQGLTELGLKVKAVGSRLQLSGQLKTMADYKELTFHRASLKEKIKISEVTLHPELKRKVYAHFLIKVSQYNLTELNCRPLGLYINCKASQSLIEKLKALEEQFLISWESPELIDATKQYQVSLILQQYENASGQAFNFGLSKVEGKLESLLFSNPLALIQDNAVLLKEEDFRSQTLAHPMIKTRLNNPVKIRIGQRIPFLQSVTNGVATQQWRFAGLALDLTLNPYSERLKVNYKTNLSRPQDGGIAENRQESTLLIPLDQTVILFDIGFKVNQTDLSQIPFLSQVPLFGTLFKGQSRNSSYKKVLCLITVKSI